MLQFCPLRIKVILFKMYHCLEKIIYRLLWEDYGRSARYHTPKSIHACGRVQCPVSPCTYSSKAVSPCI